MLNKYEEFFKLSKHEQCSIYTAVSRQTGQSVLLKRFKNKLTWDEVLKNKNMQFSQKSKMFPRMIEIFKNKQDFYVVYERPTHSSLQEAQDIGPLSVQNFYILFHDLCQHLLTLKNNVPGLYVIPDWIFMHRHTVKILHYQPFFLSREALSSDHVYLYKVQNQILPEDKDEDSSSTIVPGSKRRNLVFNLGMISYYLLTGFKNEKPENQQDYLTMVNQISDNAQKRVLKATKDKQLAQMIQKMLSKNIFEVPQLQTVANLIERKAQGISPKKRSHTNNIEIDIEHIKLQNSRHRENENEFKRRLRPCCIEKESSLEKINGQIKMSREIREQKDKEYRQFQGRKFNLHHWEKEATPRMAKSSKKSFLPQIKPVSRRRMKTDLDLMNTTNSKPLMFNNLVYNVDVVAQIILSLPPQRSHHQLLPIKIMPDASLSHMHSIALTPQYFNISETLDQVDHSLKTCIFNLEQDKKRNIDIIDKIQGMELLLKEKLNGAKEYIFQLLQLAFQELESQLQEKLSKINMEQGLHSLGKASKIDDKLTNALIELQTLRDGLKSDRIMGSAIVFLKDKQPEATAFHNSLLAYLESNQSYSPKVEFNNQAKNQIMFNLSRLIRIEGKKEIKYKQRKPEHPSLFKSRLNKDQQQTEKNEKFEKIYTPEKSNNYCRPAQEGSMASFNNNSPYRDKITVKPVLNYYNKSMNIDSYRSRGYNPADSDMKMRRGTNVRRDQEIFYQPIS